ncbi:hypothetical protein N9A28_08610 [Sulfurimonas sp.]|nr:hypothetical protein [Sulfurimonas sp.]
MIYIVIALKPEAQAFVDKYKLKKTKLNEFTLHANSEFMIIVSGIGVSNSQKATETLRKNFDIQEDDSFINIGICGANENHPIGEMIKINSSDEITCVNEPAYKGLYELVDMESDGFFNATQGLENVCMYKVVSDHFDPKSVTKEKTKKLIFNNIDKIMESVKNG